MRTGPDHLYKASLAQCAEMDQCPEMEWKRAETEQLRCNAGNLSTTAPLSELASNLLPRQAAQ
jgi:hypothetical protein